MSFFRGLLKRGANRVLSPFGLEIIRSQLARASDIKAEGFPEYLLEAEKLNMDVNDWIEQRLGWEAALPLLEQIVIPHLREDSVVCELGAGTGRHARHIAPRLTRGELHLVDYSPWTVAFFAELFSGEPQRVCLSERWLFSAFPERVEY